MSIRKKDIIVIVVCFTVLIAFLTFMSVLIYRKEHRQYSYNFEYTPIAELPINIIQPEVFKESFGAGTDFSTDMVFTAGTATSASSKFTSASGYNAILYDYSSTYFKAYYGDRRLSPILPMAISNVETPGRADFKKTFSALFPSGVVSCEEIATFDVTQAQKYPQLLTEYSTRDRGALQMSPTYGTGNATFNAQMSGTEVDKLGNITTQWEKGASSSPGDRFYLPDVLLRMSAAMQQQCDNMARNDYPPVNDFQLVAMCAMGHHQSGVWGNKNHNAKIGCWRSSQKAYDWACLIGDEKFVELLTIQARNSNKYYIDSNQAKKIFESYYTVNAGDYATNTIVCWYPVKALYSYIKLCMAYNK